MMKKARKNKTLLILFALIGCLQFLAEPVQGLALSLTSKVKQDSAFISIYSFEAGELEIMRQSIMDSCVSKFQCDRLEYVLLSIEEDGRCLSFNAGRIPHHPALPLASEWALNMAAIEVNGTYFLLPEKIIISNAFFKAAEFKGKMLIDKDTFKYKCLHEEIEGEKFIVLFNFTFILCSGNALMLRDYSILTDSGDIGLHPKLNFWGRLSLFFRKLFSYSH